MKKPVIALTSSKTDFKNLPFEHSTFSNSKAEIYSLADRGAIPVVVPFLSEEDALEFMQQCDGLFVTGGADVDPAQYGEEKLPCCGDIEPDRDIADLNLIKAALKLNKPVMAVCRGSQLMTVHFGGTLYQDLKTQFGAKTNHPDLYRTKGEESHEVQLIPGTPLYNLMGKIDHIGVNSTHHQGFKTLGPDVKPMAYATDGLCESWYYDKNGAWVRVYQWHPEMMDYNPRMDAILKDFINECIARKENK